MKTKSFFALLLLIVTALGCGKDNDDSLDCTDCITAQGRIADWGEPAVDGCGWLIEIDEVTYAMDKIDETFKIANLKVKVTYKKTKESYACAWGNPKFPIIEVVKMEKL